METFLALRNEHLNFTQGWCICPDIL